MSYELFPLAIAGVIVYSFRDQIKAIVSGDSSTEVKESEYSLEYINPEPVLLEKSLPDRFINLMPIMVLEFM
jgi:hypothetical protein